MPNKIIVVLMMASLLLSTALASPVQQQEGQQERLEIHVSPKGNNGGTGSPNSPLATLDQARLAVKRLKASTKDTPIDVIFHQGVYRFSSTVYFDDFDSGTPSAPITYRAAEGANVEFKGSVELDISVLQPITDKAITDRLPATARGKVGWLDLRKQGISSLPSVSGMTAESSSDINFYLNQKEQMISQWPNGDENYTQWTNIINAGGEEWTGVGGGVIEFSEYNPRRWAKATDYYMSGYFGADYRHETAPVAKVDVSSKQITLAAGTDFGIINRYSKRWKVFNLLEEIDMPGEWYVDRTNMILYYYPEYSLRDAEFEMSSLTEPMISMVGVAHISFQGINFSQTCGTAIHAKNNVEALNVRDCSFKYIGGAGIYLFGDTLGAIDALQNWANRIDGGKNCSFERNSFVYMGAEGIRVTGGNRDTLEPSGIVIANNYFYKTARVNRSACAINLYSTVAAKVINNTIHNSGFHGINYIGNDNEISYNEIYNTCRASSDAGAIYSGRNFIQRGNVLSYNYIHESNGRDKYIVTPYNRGIYLDDAMSGQIVHNNIVKTADIGIAVNGGQANLVYDNIVIDSEKAVELNSWTMDEPGRKERDSFQGEESTNFPIYGIKYPEIKEGITKFLGKPALNRATGNLTVDGDNNIVAAAIEFGNVENNIVTSDYSVFVNPDEQDYRVRADSEVAKQLTGVLSENFDLSEIGLQEQVNKNADRDFRLLYPQNGASDINSKKCTFYWQDSLGADKYRFVLALDWEFKNIVIDQEVETNFHFIDELEADKTTYYWKVYALNTSKDVLPIFESAGKPYMFTTVRQAANDTEQLLGLVEESEKKISTIKEGDTPGLYKKGTIETLTQETELARRILRGFRVDEQEFQRVVTTLDQIIYGEENINRGFANLGQYFADTGNWVTSVPDGLQVNEQELILYNDMAEPIIGYKPLTDASKSVILSFKMKLNYSNSWMGMGMRADPNLPLYASGNNNYFFAIKKDIIEFQKNSGGTNAIVEIIDNEFLEDNKWYDIQFGAVNVGVGQLIVLRIDGKTAYSYLDTSDNQVYNKGGFVMSATPGYRVHLKPADTLDNNFDEIINENTMVSATSLCKELESKIGYDTTILRLDSGNYFANGQIGKSEVYPIMIEDKPMIPLEFTIKLLDEQVIWDEQASTINIKTSKGIVVFDVENQQTTLNGQKLDGIAQIKDGVLMVDVKTLSDISGMEILWLNEGLVIIAQANNLNHANEGGLITLIADFLSK